MLDLGWR